jgi:hypothetical protein
MRLSLPVVVAVVATHRYCQLAMPVLRLSEIMSKFFVTRYQITNKNRFF